MKISRFFGVLALFLLSLAPKFSNAQGLTFYCKNPELVGRAIYACSAYSAVQSGLTSLTLDPVKSYSTLKKNCSTTCKSNSSCKKGDKKCLVTCGTDCESEYYKTNAKGILTAIKNYDKACRVSLGGTACEKNEAKAFCDYKLLELAKKYSAPKTFNDFSALVRYYDKAVGAYQKRMNNLTNELKKYSDQMREKVNSKLGCEYLPQSSNICSEALSTVSATSSLEEHYAIFALRVEKSEKGYCSKGKGCVKDACTPDRDDNAYTTEATGGTCYCDEYCCQAGDCCGNFTGACAGVVDTTKCSNTTALISNGLMSVDYSDLRKKKRMSYPAN